MSWFKFFSKKGSNMKVEKLLTTDKTESGTPVDVEDWQSTTVQVGGNDKLKPFVGQVDIEVSLDGDNYSPIRTFIGEGVQTLDGTYSRVRATTVKMTGGPVTVFVAGR